VLQVENVALVIELNLGHLAPTTIAILGSTLSEKHHAFRNKKILHEKVREKKDEMVPAGYKWQGM
jgi:hypothetical protein